MTVVMRVMSSPLLALLTKKGATLKKTFAAGHKILMTYLIGQETVAERHRG